MQAMNALLNRIFTPGFRDAVRWDVPSTTHGKFWKEKKKYRIPGLLVIACLAFSVYLGVLVDFSMRIRSTYTPVCISFGALGQWTATNAKACIRSI